MLCSSSVYAHLPASKLAVAAATGSLLSPAQLKEGCVAPTASCSLFVRLSRTHEGHSSPPLRLLLRKSEGEGLACTAAHSAAALFICTSKASEGERSLHTPGKSSFGVNTCAHRKGGLATLSALATRRKKTSLEGKFLQCEWTADRFDSLLPRGAHSHRTPLPKHCKRRFASRNISLERL